MMHFGIMDTGWGGSFAEHKYGDAFSRSHPGYEWHFSLSEGLSLFSNVNKAYPNCKYYYLVDPDKMILVAAVTKENAWRIPGYVGPYDSAYIAYGIADLQRTSKPHIMGSQGVERSCLELNKVHLEACMNYGDEITDKWYTIVRTAGAFRIPIIGRSDYVHPERAGHDICVNIHGKISSAKVFSSPEKMMMELNVPPQALISYGSFYDSFINEPSNKALVIGRVTSVLGFENKEKSFNNYYIRVESLESYIDLSGTTAEEVNVNDFIYAEAKLTINT